jgi:transcriptional regulator with XRE-family HTH domain
VTRYDSTLFPTNLQRLRTDKGLTQASLAAKAGMKPCVISFFECGSRSPNLKNLVALCDALQCSPSDLLIKTP